MATFFEKLTKCPFVVSVLKFNTMWKRRRVWHTFSVQNVNLHPVIGLIAFLNQKQLDLKEEGEGVMKSTYVRA